MLFKQDFLEGIREGKITVAFRQWRRPTLKAVTLLTAVGQLAIRSVEKVSSAALKSRDATQAGFASLAELREDLAKQRAGELYRIRFELAGPDPRTALREKSALSASDRRTLEGKLARLDQRSTAGPWTRQVLTLIAKHPERRAAELAELSRREKEWLKLHLRKLKNLGLTESLEIGYRLSPRGQAYLAAGI